MSGARRLVPSGDATRCVGAGQCVLTAPEVFDQDDDGTVVVLAEEVDESYRALLAEAAYLCPASAISFAEHG
ncbi:ferredoxin [Allorhizocola rhizosphaerae]|uniref:ferredoxin n=1 Tax=Allorhizocola rhizosphaerae TaxID=1872709 RepID=UPI001FE9AECE|nr:ferredoxin [Allorhizocola rhizosphaerae]